MSGGFGGLVDLERAKDEWRVLVYLERKKDEWRGSIDLGLGRFGVSVDLGLGRFGVSVNEGTK